MKKKKKVVLNIDIESKLRTLGSEDSEGLPSPLKQIRAKSPAKNDFVKALRKMKEDEYLKKHGLRLRRKSFTLQNNTKILSVSLSRSKLKEFKKRRRERQHHMSTGYLQSQLDGLQTERSDKNTPDVLDILRIDPMSSLATRN